MQAQAHVRFSAQEYNRLEMPPLCIRQFGGMVAMYGDRVVHRFQAGKRGLLLATLLRSPGSDYSREYLCEFIWPDADPNQGRGTLRQALTFLRTCLEPPGSPYPPVFVTSHGTVRVDPATVTTDVLLFEDVVSRAMAMCRIPNESSSKARIEMLQRAADLYGGELLPGYYEDWVLVERDRLQRSYLQILHYLVRELRDQGRLQESVEYSAIAVKNDLDDERAWRDLIECCWMNGDTRAALDEYRRLQRRLKDYLGAEPETETIALVEKIRTSKKAGGSAAAGRTHNLRPEPSHEAALESGNNEGSEPDVCAVSAQTAEELRKPEDIRRESAPRTGASAYPLPFGNSKIWGRQADLQKLRTWMIPASSIRSNHGEPEYSGLPGGIGFERLVTITGPGGVGKTTLATTFARELANELDRHSELTRLEVCFIPLAGVREPADILIAVRDGLKIQPSTSATPEEQVVGFVGERRLVLILDNFEQLAGSGGDIVVRLLESCRSLQCLVTSRRLLSVQGERELPLGPLAYPDRPATVTRLIDFPAVQMFVERCSSASPGFRITPSNAHAIAAVCRRLEGLPLAIELAAARAGVFQPHEMLDRLANRFSFLTSRLRRMEPRHRTLRAAVDWSFEQLPPDLSRVFLGLSVFQGGFTVEAAKEVTQSQSIEEHLAELIDRSLVVRLAPGEREREISDAPTPVRARIDATCRFDMLDTIRDFAQLVQRENDPDTLELFRFYHARYFATWVTGIETELKSPGASLALDRVSSEIANIRSALAWTLLDDTTQYGTENREQDDPTVRRCEGATDIHENHLNAGLTAPFPSEAVRPLRDLRIVIGMEIAGRLWRYWSSRGDVHEGRDWLETAVALEERSRSKRRTEQSGFSLARCLLGAGVLASRMSDLGASFALFNKALTLREMLGDRAGMAEILTSMGNAAQAQGDHTAAAAYQQRSLAIREAIGDLRGVGVCHNNLGLICEGLGDIQRAKRHYHEAVNAYRALDLPDMLASTINNLGGVLFQEKNYLEALRLFHDCLTIMRRHGYTWHMAQALHNIGECLSRLNKLDEAAPFLVESMATHMRLGHIEGVAHDLSSIANIASKSGRSIEPVLLHAAAERARSDNGTPLSPAEAREFAADVREVQSRLSESEFGNAWQHGRELTLEAAIHLAHSVLGFSVQTDTSRDSESNSNREGSYGSSVGGDEPGHAVVNGRRISDQQPPNLPAKS